MTPKSLAGPPSEFEHFRVPPPSSAPETETSGIFIVNYDMGMNSPYGELVKRVEGSENEFGTTAELANSPVNLAVGLIVDSPTQFAFSLFCPADEVLDLVLIDPNGNLVDLTSAGESSSWPIGSYNVPGTVYTFVEPIVGKYMLTISSSGTPKQLREKFHADSTAAWDVLVTIWNEDSELSLLGYSNTFEDHLVGENLGLSASMYDGSSSSSSSSGAPKIIDFESEESSSSLIFATMIVVNPTGQMQNSPMSSNPNMLKKPLSESKLAAGGGWFAADITPSESGFYTVQSSFYGLDDNGVAFFRTTEHALYVDTPTVAFADSSSLAELVGLVRPGGVHTFNRDDEDVLTVCLPVELLEASAVGEKLRAYFEVYGLDASGVDTAVAWVSSMVYVSSASGNDEVCLQLDNSWITLAGVDVETLYVAYASLSDASTHNPLSVLESDDESQVRVPLVFETKASVQLARKNLAKNRAMRMENFKDNEITLEMRQGKTPPAEFFGRGRFGHVKQEGEAESNGLVLTHGFCTAVNPWEDSSSSFTGNTAYFFDPTVSRTNDEFAIMLGDFGDASFDSFSLIGHSQGGLASLHLHNYYFSALETPGTPGKNLIQSLGSPYQGNSGASVLGVGKAFGVGCGDNVDLTKAGALLWLSGITATSTADVYYYTTQYALGSMLNYCNLATNLVLTYPNDGLAEYKYSQLDGANDMGHTLGWCHSEGMKFPPQFTDQARNAVLNDNASR